MSLSGLTLSLLAHVRFFAKASTGVDCSRQRCRAVARWARKKPPCRDHLLLVVPPSHRRAFSHDCSRRGRSHAVSALIGYDRDGLRLGR